MRNLIAALILFLVSPVYAADITIVDFSKTYEHQFTNCTVNLHNSEFLYASCETYAAPFISYQQSDWSSPLYDEIGINGVFWHGCKMTGDPVFSIRIECNVPVSMSVEVFDEFDRPVHNWFRFYRPYYGPYTR